jgi:protease II
MPKLKTVKKLPEGHNAELYETRSIVSNAIDALSVNLPVEFCRRYGIVKGSKIYVIAGYGIIILTEHLDDYTKQQIEKFFASMVI